jgi:hypothetical protein
VTPSAIVPARLESRREAAFSFASGVERSIDRSKPPVAIAIVIRVSSSATPSLLDAPAHRSLRAALILNKPARSPHCNDMNVQRQIDEYIASQPEPKRSDMQELHHIMLQEMPACQLWFLDGRDSANKIVANPNIGYGCHTITYADGKSREFYQIGLSANKTGISVYILGIDDKKYLSQTFGTELGKASVSGYCIKFKSLKDINVDVLRAAVRYGVEARS